MASVRGWVHPATRGHVRRGGNRRGPKGSGGKGRARSLDGASRRLPRTESRGQGSANVEGNRPRRRRPRRESDRARLARQERSHGHFPRQRGRGRRGALRAYRADRAQAPGNSRQGSIRSLPLWADSGSDCISDRFTGDSESRARRHRRRERRRRGVNGLPTRTGARYGRCCMVSEEPAEVLHGRREEREALGGLLEAVRGGQSRVLVVSGEPGVGKTALVESVIGSSSGFRVVRAVGVESEMELAFAALQQLCAPMLDRLGELPVRQRDALGVAFGLRAEDAPDRFLVGLAVLSLLAEVAEEQPLVCVVDDAQWLDRASAQALVFVGRRLLAEAVALLLVTRDPSDELTGLPKLPVEGLRNGDARALLGSVLGVPLDERVRERLVAETRGNPLALLELPRGLTPAGLAGGFGLLDAPGLSGRIEDSFRRRLAGLSADTQRLLLVAAAEPVGDPVLVWKAAGRLGIGLAAAADTDGLLAIGTRVTFRHPLVRSSVYRAASAPERQAVHRALAEATDPEMDPDRRAWHLAQAT